MPKFYSNGGWLIIDKDHPSVIAIIGGDATKRPICKACGRPVRVWKADLRIDHLGYVKIEAECHGYEMIRVRPLEIVHEVMDL